MIDFMQIMGLPLAACLVLTGIHAYLGLHVIQRQVIFVDLALAQIAVLGTSCGFLLGLDLDHPLSYALSLGFTVAGAALFAMSRFRRQLVPQEAIIGIIYVVASSLTVILLGFSGEGTEHIRQFLIGNILLVGWRDVIKILSLYTGVGLLHYFCRHKFFLITNDPQRAFQKGLNVRLWDFLLHVIRGGGHQLGQNGRCFAGVFIPGHSGGLRDDTGGPAAVTAAHRVGNGHPRQPSRHDCFVLCGPADRCRRRLHLRNSVIDCCLSASESCVI